MERLFCLELLLGKAKVERLKKSFVVVLGIGAVGSYAVEALARAGIRRLRLVDFDTIKTTNFNRHLLAVTPNLGKLKTEAAKERIAQINSHCKVEVLNEFAAEETMERITEGKPDLVIDAVDSLNPKVQILAYCHEKRSPLFPPWGRRSGWIFFLSRREIFSKRPAVRWPVTSVHGFGGGGSKKGFSVFIPTRRSQKSPSNGPASSIKNRTTTAAAGGTSWAARRP